MAGRRSPHFFKIFMPQLHSKQLVVPSDFLKHMEGESAQTIALIGPSGNQWDVNLMKRGSAMEFDDGWNEFVVDHSLGSGDFLVFRYDNNSHFTVFIFDVNSCEKETAFSAKPSKGTIDLGESKCREKVKTPIENQVTQLNSKRKKESDECSNAIKKLYCSNLTIEEYHSPSSEEEFVTPLRTIDVTTEEDLLTASSSDDALNDTKRRKVQPSISSSKGTKETSAIMLGESFSAPLKSQRRPVTQEELDRAFEMSKSFKSTNPFTTLAMRDSYCYHHFQLNLPFNFAKKHMRKVNMKMTLWDPEGRSWTVAYLYYRRRASLRSGWNKFSFANNLESGDVCIFELIKPDEMRVHIFRVLDQVTPLIRFNPRNNK